MNKKMYAFLCFFTLSFMSCLSTQNVLGQKLTREEKYIQNGDSYLTQRQYTQAIKAYNKALKENPDSEIALQRLAEYYYKNEDWKNAISYYERLIKMFPENHDYNCRCGFAYFFFGYEHANGTSFFTNVSKEYPYPSEFYNMTRDEQVRWENDWRSSDIYYTSRKDGEYAAKTKDISGGRKGKLYSVYEKSFNYFSKALAISPTWESYFGMGLIYAFFSPLNFVAMGGPEYNWSMNAMGDFSKAEEFFLKSIESKPNWQSYFSCTKECYFSKFVNTDSFTNQKKKYFIDFLTEGINLALSSNAPDYVLLKMYYYRGYFYKTIEGKFDLAFGDLQKAKKLEDKIRGSEVIEDVVIGFKTFKATTEIRSMLEQLQEYFEDENTAKQLGYSSVETYRAEKRKQEEIAKQKELAKKRVTDDNFFSQVLYKKGIPLEIGDDFTIPKNRLEVLDRVVDKTGYTYLVTYWLSEAQASIDYGQSFFGGGVRYCFYIQSKNELNISRISLYAAVKSTVISNDYPLKIICTGVGQYQRNFQNEDCYVFKLLKEVK